MRRAADKKHGRGVMLYGTSGKANNGEYSWCCAARWPCLRFVCAGALRFYLLTCMCRQRCAGDKYDGEWVHHQRHGQCTYTWASGEVPMTVVIRCRVQSSMLRRL